jgi:chromosome segregation ATPase
MAINPTRAEARLAKTVTALKAIINLERKIKGWLEDQDQRQVQVTLLENQISALKDTLAPEKIDAPPNEENAPILENITKLEAERDQIVVVYGETSKLLNEATAEAAKLRRDNPHATPESIAAQEAALARKQAAYPRLLLRHLYKCKAHGWADARMAKLTEHRTHLREERRKLEQPVEEMQAEATPTEATPEPTTV